MLLKVGSQLQIVNPLNKTASQVKEADTSFVTPKDDNFTYFQCIAVHADVANQNADIFPLDELKKSYSSFIGRGLFMDHNASCVANAVGKIFDAKLIELPNATADEGKYGVLCLCGIDKTTHPDIAAKVAHGVIDSVSMGANVNEAECEICHCVAHTPEEFCIHLQHQGQLDPATGKKCCSINRGVNFTELSLVSVPADPYAKMQQVFANFVGAMKKQAEIPEKKWNEKFSFNIPCGNDKICEMLYNLLSSYEKQGILDLSKDGPVLKLSVEAGSKEEALQKLEYISKEQGFGVKEPLKKDTEENLMTKDNKEVKEEVKEEVKTTASLGKEASDIPSETVWKWDDYLKGTVGSFYQYLAKAISVADEDNTELLRASYPNLVALSEGKLKPTASLKRKAEASNHDEVAFFISIKDKIKSLASLIQNSSLSDEDKETLNKYFIHVLEFMADNIEWFAHVGFNYSTEEEEGKIFNSADEQINFVEETINKVITEGSVTKDVLVDHNKLMDLDKSFQDLYKTVLNKYSSDVKERSERERKSWEQRNPDSDETKKIMEEEKVTPEENRAVNDIVRLLMFPKSSITPNLTKEAFLNKMSKIYDNLAKGNIMNKEAVDTKIKDYQRQTKDFQGEPIEAPENVVDSLNQIKELRTKISEKEVELAKITQELGIEDLNDELQNVLNGAADSLKNLQGQVLRYGKQLITYQEEVKTQDFKPTITWIKEKLAKYPEALAYIEKAIDGAQNMAKKTETSTIKVYDPNNK